MGTTPKHTIMINQIEQKPIKFAEEKREVHDNAGLDTFATHIGSHSIIGSFSVLLAIAGSGIQYYADGTFDIFLVAFLLFLTVIMIVNIFILKGSAGLRVFLFRKVKTVVLIWIVDCKSVIITG